MAASWLTTVNEREKRNVEVNETKKTRIEKNYETEKVESLTEWKHNVENGKNVNFSSSFIWNFLSFFLEHPLRPKYIVWNWICRCGTLTPDNIFYVHFMCRVNKTSFILFYCTLLVAKLRNPSLHICAVVWDYIYICWIQADILERWLGVKRSRGSNWNESYPKKCKLWSQKVLFANSTHSTNKRLEVRCRSTYNKFLSIIMLYILHIIIMWLLFYDT